VSLFARSFLLIALLIVTAVLASFQIYRLYELEPRSRELAQQTVSAVNLTRAALVAADPFLRRQLLVELNDTEGLRVYPATASEKLVALPDEALFQRVVGRVRQALGGETRFASERDGEDGFWVSFLIDSDEFWVMLPWERFEPTFGLQWLGWGLALVALSLAGAWFIASNLARPLAAVTRAARRICGGGAHQPLAEEGPRELRTVAKAFNRMASSLESMERERAMVLAGISHDLRTPLSRLRLALEMSGAESGASAAMIEDIGEIDAIIGQFLDFARGENEEKSRQPLDPLLHELGEHYRRLGKNVSVEAATGAQFSVARMALRRALANLVDNALRYAGEPIEIEAKRGPESVAIEVRDRGPGIPAGEAERLKRPFTRLDDARSGASGAGLGLAIVERVARGHGGTLELLPRAGGGLVARLTLRA
jgi:two-component system, OmpR family, osmolarity sensor histidine kinase EnvZ